MKGPIPLGARRVVETHVQSRLRELMDFKIKVKCARVNHGLETNVSTANPILPDRSAGDRLGCLPSWKIGRVAA